MSNRGFPNKIHEVDGNHKVAIDRTEDIHRYVDEALAEPRAAYDTKCAPYVRAGLVQQGNDTLDTIIRFANCAKDELKRAYVPKQVAG